MDVYKIRRDTMVRWGTKVFDATKSKFPAGRVVVLSTAVLASAVFPAQAADVTSLEPGSASTNIRSNQDHLNLGISPLDQENDFQKKLRNQEKIEESLDRHNRGSLIKEIPPATPQPAAADNGIKFPISTIYIDVGEDKEWAVDTSDIIKNYIGRDLGSPELFSLIRDVTNRYAEAGFSTTTVSLIPKNMKSGTVDLKVNWGKVDGWLINGKAPETRYEKLITSMAMPRITERPFNIYDIDQIVENLNTVAKTARVDVRPSPRLGYSLLNIITEEKAGPSVTLRADNSGLGSPSQGRYRFTVSTSLSDLLMGNDALGMNLSSRRYQDDENNGEYSAGFNYAIPYGYSKLDIRFSQTQYDKQLRGRFGSYDSSGTSQLYAAKLSHVLMREKTQRLSAIAELEHKRNNNFIEGARVVVNSKPYTSFSLGVDHVTEFLGGSLYSDMAWVRGIPWFGGEAAAFDRHRAEKNFNKLEFNTAWSRPLVLLGRNINFSSRLGGQLSKQNMLTSEQLGLGDEFTVRGYRTPLLWGDRGVFLNNTLSMPLSVLGGSVSPFVGWDFGRAENIAYEENNGNISGIAVGANSSWRHGGVSLTVSSPLSKRLVDKNDADSPVLYISAYLTY